MKTFTSLGQLIDSSEEDFREYCSPQSIGYLSGLHNLLLQAYNNVTSLKDDLVKNVRLKKDSATDEEKKTLEGLYSKLLRIEQRVFIVREYIKSKQL